MAGYSSTPLFKKLGIKPESKILLIDEPENYFELVETNLEEQLCGNQTPDLVHLFVKNKTEFESTMKKLKSLIAKNSKIVIWVSWYKKATGIKTDVTEDTVRNYALKNGLVDVKVCAVSEIWSGLKLVVPVKLRVKK